MAICASDLALPAIGRAGERRNEATQTTISAAEGVAPEVIGGGLCHPGVPFRMDAPTPGFVIAPDQEQVRPNLRLWVWHREETGERLIVQILKGSRWNPDGFRDFVRGIKSSASDGSTLLGERVSTEATPYEGILSFALEQGGQIDQRCLSHGPTQDPSWVVCVGTVAVDGSAFQALRDSLTLASC